MKQRLILLPAIISIFVLYLNFTGFLVRDFRSSGAEIPVMEMFGFGMGLFYFLTFMLLSASFVSLVSTQGNTNRKMSLLRKDKKIIRRSKAIMIICGTGILIQSIIIYYLFWRVTTPTL